MLAPRDRALLLQSLRAPTGYRLDSAIGTSFSLDLLALLTAPLAFAFHAWEDEEGRPAADPVALLHALRENAGRIRIFCQAGRIQAPGPGQPLLAFLERSVVEVTAPRRGGVFHPKAWVLRYTAPDEPVLYRALVASRNLTFDRSWDTLLALDGTLRDRTRAIRRNGPLADFVAALPGLAVQPLPAEERRPIERMAEELRRVAFEEPEGFDDLAFHPLGIPGYGEHWPLAGGGLRRVVVAPFLSDTLLDELVDECTPARVPERLDLHLVSRPESLATLRPETLARFRGVWTLSADAEPEGGDEESAPVEREPTAPDEALTGLHAKLYVLQRDKKAHVFTGSANATSAAFERNVELLVELVGGYVRAGVSQILGDEEDGGAGTLRELLEPWEPAQVEPDPDEERRKALEERIETARTALASASLALRATVVDGESFDLSLHGSLPGLPEGVTLRCWPASRSDRHAVEPSSKGELALFRGLAPSELTAFLAFELVAKDGGLATSARFARRLPLEGLPPDREERLLRAILKDKETVLRMLWMLLARDELAATDLALGAGEGRGAFRAPLGGMPLLEALVRSLARDPEALDAVQRLIDDLARTEDGRALLPDGLDAIWEPIRAAREELGR